MPDDTKHFTDLLQKLASLEDGEYLFDRPEGEDGAILAMRVGHLVKIESGPDRKVFHRNAIKYPGGQHVRWLVVQYNGTNIYFTPEGVIVTDKELNP